MNLLRASLCLLTLLVSCSDDAEVGHNNSAGGASGIVGRVCGKDQACSAGAACKLVFIEGNIDCACEQSAFSCKNQGGGAAPPSLDTTLPCDLDYCKTGTTFRCSYKDGDCDYEIQCDFISPTPVSVKGSCPEPAGNK